MLTFATGSCFGAFSIYSIAKSCKRQGYEELDEIEQIDQINKPGLCGMCLAFFFFLMVAFRMAWLIFGSVQVFSSTSETCISSVIFYAGFIYCIVEWSLVGATLIICCGCCWGFMCCAIGIFRG